MLLRAKMRPLTLLKCLSVVLFMILAAGFYKIPPVYAQVTDPAKRAELESQLQQLQQEADQLDKNLQEVQGESNTLANEISSLNIEIKRRELEVKRLTLVLKQTDLEIQDKSSGIKTLSQKIEVSKKGLAASLFLLYAYGQDNIFNVLLKNQNLSDFFSSVDGLNRVQSNIQSAMAEFKTNQAQLEQEKTDLQSFEEDQQNLKALQDMERRFLAQKKQEKDEILRLTKGKEALFQQLLKSKNKDIAALKTQLFYLEKTGVTAEDAIHYADLAAKRAGIRTSFLLALLEVETGKQFEDGVITAGTHLGNGNWNDDLYKCYIRLGKRSAAEAEKNAYFAITGKLNLDPDSMPVSRRYPNGAGCGGAMGPAQFMPTTWLRFESQVAALTGHNPPNPWKIEDAFTASAVFLASAGADSQTRSGELAAARVYISGVSDCYRRRGGARAICLNYSKNVLDLAGDIEQSIKISFLDVKSLVLNPVRNLITEL